MEITEVRIKLMDDSDDRLQGFCSITFDNAFVVRDLKIIEGVNGPFVAMPSRKLTAHCHLCRSKNHLRANYCNHCGTKLRHDREPTDADGRAKLYADIAHPINSACREMIQNRVIQGYREELERSKQPGYISRYDDYFDVEDYDVPEPPKAPLKGPHRRPASEAGEQIPPLPSASDPNDSSSSPQSPSAGPPKTPHSHLKPKSGEKQLPGDSNFGAGVFE